MNITWVDQVVADSGVSKTNYFDPGTVARYYTLKYDVIIDGSVNIALDESITTDYMNSDSLLWHLIDGLPGPSHKIDITMKSYLDCKNYQGPLESLNEKTYTAYTSKSLVKEWFLAHSWFGLKSFKTLNKLSIVNFFVVNEK